MFVIRFKVRVRQLNFDLRTFGLGARIVGNQNKQIKTKKAPNTIGFHATVDTTGYAYITQKRLLFSRQSITS